MFVAVGLITAEYLALASQPICDDRVRLKDRLAVDRVPRGVLEPASAVHRVHESHLLTLDRSVVVRTERRRHVYEPGSLFTRHELTTKHAERPLRIDRHCVE